MLGSAAMLLSFDVAPDAIAQHDDWHTHEHLPERLSIPGFLRGTRWVALRGQPRYLVLYEVKEIGVLTSAAYLNRLNHPSAWTTKIMAHYRNMSRGLCSVTGSFGLGTGYLALVLRFKPGPGTDAALRRWLVQDVLPQLPPRPGLGSAHLLEGAVAPQMTNEQRLRGADANVDWAVLVSGYDEQVLSTLRDDVLRPGDLEGHGAVGIVDGLYRLHYALTRHDVEHYEGASLAGKTHSNQ
jgi:hypothetical protein